jgi:hypothetical protein
MPRRLRLDDFGAGRLVRGHHTFGVTSREKGRTQRKQQFARSRLVVRVHEILHHEGAVQLPRCFAVGKHLGRPSGSHLAVMDRFRQV